MLTPMQLGKFKVFKYLNGKNFGFITAATGSICHIAISWCSRLPTR
jgi:hypothetical protein